MRKKQEQIKKLRKKGNKYIKDGKLDKAIEVFLEGLNLDPNDETNLKNLSDLYLQLKEYQKAEYYADLLLNINKNNIEANNIKFISLIRQNKKEDADKFLENNEILKNQPNYIELKALINPEILKNQIIEEKSNKINSYKINYNKLFKIEGKQFYIESKYAPDYKNPKLTLLEKQEHGTKIIANEDIKKGELLCVSKALLVHLEESINRISFFKNIYEKLTEEEKDQFLTLSRKDNLNLSLKERIEKGNRNEDINEVIDIFNHNCYSIGSGKMGLSSYRYKGTGLFIFPAYFNHSCEPNTYRFTIGDIFFLIAARNIKKNSEIFTIYFGQDKTYEERQQKTQTQFGFKCECDYCKSELENIKNSEIKKECEKFKKILKDYKGFFPYSNDYKIIKEFIIKNKKELNYNDLYILAIDFDELAREDISTLKDCCEIFEEIYDKISENDNFDAFYCAQNLAAIYYDLNNYEKCKENYEKMEKNLNEIFPDNPEFVEKFIQKIHKKDENLSKLKFGVNNDYQYILNEFLNHMYK